MESAYLCMRLQTVYRINAMLSSKQNFLRAGRPTFL